MKNIIFLHETLINGLSLDENCEYGGGFVCKTEEYIRKQAAADPVGVLEDYQITQESNEQEIEDATQEKIHNEVYDAPCLSYVLVCDDVRKENVERLLQEDLPIVVFYNVDECLCCVKKAVIGTDTSTLNYYIELCLYGQLSEDTKGSLRFNSANIESSGLLTADQIKQLMDQI